MKKILLNLILSIALTSSVLAMKEDDFYKDGMPDFTPCGAKMHEAYKCIAQQNKIITRDGYVTKRGVAVDLSDSIRGSKKTSYKSNQKEFKNMTSKTPHKSVVEVKNQGTLEAAFELLRSCRRVACLNFAHPSQQGGGYLSGGLAQEEELCRRTTLYPVLCHLASNGQYPMQDGELIYTPGLQIFRASWRENFALCDEPMSIDVITQAAYIKEQNSQFTEEEHEGMRNKIIHQLRIAMKHDVDGLVLGAFGCGGFNNDPDAVSQIYQDVLRTDEFRNAFAIVQFAILDKKGGRNITIFTKNLDNLFDERSNFVKALTLTAKNEVLLKGKPLVKKAREGFASPIIYNAKLKTLSVSGWSAIKGEGSNKQVVVFYKGQALEVIDVNQSSGDVVEYLKDPSCDYSKARFSGVVDLSQVSLDEFPSAIKVIGLGNKNDFNFVTMTSIIIEN